MFQVVPERGRVSEQACVRLEKLLPIAVDVSHSEAVSDELATSASDLPHRSIVRASKQQQVPDIAGGRKGRLVSGMYGGVGVIKRAEREGVAGSINAVT